MKRVFIAAAMTAMLFASSNASADITLAFASFENTAELGGQYTDTGDPLVDHDLVNNATEAAVDTVGLAGDLAFDASYVNTRDDVGLTDGDFVGVTDFDNDVGAFTDGVQGYQMSDADGRMDLASAAVDISGQGDVTFTMDFFLNATSYEGTLEADLLRIYLDVDGNETDLFFQVSTALNGFAGVWNPLSQVINGNSATLNVWFDSNAGPEAVYLDNIAFTVVEPIPEPGAMGVLALLGCAGFLRRRK